jgi:phosphoenolpyruvate-protein kinase (PTS system EI component)
LALSGDVPSAQVTAGVAGVGLIRSEYVLRASGAYVTLSEGRFALTRYARIIAQRFAPRPVWLRSADFEAREIGTLRGCDAVVTDENPILGDRGIRRAQRFPEAFELELASAVEAAHGAANLGLLFSYVNDTEALDFAIRVARAAGWQGPLGTMVETPCAASSIDAFLRRDLQLVVVGMNDLTSLFLGAQRGSSFARKDHPELIALVERVARACRDAQVRCLLAGNFDAEALRILAHLPTDGLVLHHYELPQLLPGRFDVYEDLQVVPQIKATTARLLESPEMRA